MTYDRGQYQEKWRLERSARAVRERLGLAQTEILNPLELAEALPAHVFFPEDIADGELVRRLRGAAWDGFAFTFPGEETLIVVLNSARPWRRQCSTLLEELSHHLLGHEPSRIYTEPASGMLRREFNARQEAEAYDFGSVLLLPKELIQYHVKVRQAPAQELADRCGCSVEYVEFRIKRCRLWDRYNANIAQ